MHLHFGLKWDEFYIGLCREIVAEADKDGTGQLTIQEFTNSPKVYFNLNRLFKYHLSWKVGWQRFNIFLWKDPNKQESDQDIQRTRMKNKLTFFVCHRCTVYTQWCSEAELLDKIQAKVLSVFLLAIHSHLYRFIFLQAPATSYRFYSSVTVHCKEERRKTL
jgi:hypothetical protein